MTHNESNYALVYRPGPGFTARGVVFVDGFTRRPPVAEVNRIVTRDRGLFPAREARHYLLMEITMRPTLPAPEWAFRD